MRAQSKAQKVYARGGLTKPPANAKIKSEINGSGINRSRERDKMKVYDLTHELKNGMPVYPGTSEPCFAPACTIEKDGFKETKMSMLSHTGTHIDAPAHLIEGGMELDKLDVSQFIGSAIVIDCRDIPENGAITMEHLTKYGDDINNVDFILFNTGWDEKWGKPEYYKGYPCIDHDVVNLIASGSYKGIGFDAISVDPVDEPDLPRHKKILARNDIINIENLRDLDKLPGGIIMFSCLPLKLHAADGCSARAIAWAT